MATDTHLFVLVHGLWGGAGHLKSIDAVIKQNIVDSKEHIHVLRPKTSSLLKTYNGIEIIGHRMMLEIFEELKKLSDKGKNVTKISIIGYSLGGVVSRYIVGELERMGIFDTIEPQYFATFATPHLGVWFFKSRYQALNVLGSNILGLVGSELFIKDSEKILVKLTEGDYINGLKKFRKRFCFANIRHDRTVSFYTAFITDKNPFEEHWDKLDISFDFKDHKILPKYKIRGVEVSPKIVDFQNSTFRSKEYKKPSPSFSKRLKYFGIFVTLAFIIPFWLPFVFTVTSIGSLVSYVIVKTYKRAAVPQLTDVLNLDSKDDENSNDDDDVGLKEKIDEATGAALEDVINITQYDSTTESSRDESTDDVYDSEEQNILLQTISNLYHKLDDQFKNPLLEKYELFQKSTSLKLDKDRQTIHDNLNKLDWYKFAVYVNVLNAHDGIVARKGLKRSTVKGIATISLFSHILNEDIKSLNN